MISSCLLCLSEKPKTTIVTKCTYTMYVTQLMQVIEVAVNVELEPR